MTPQTIITKFASRNYFETECTIKLDFSFLTFVKRLGSICEGTNNSSTFLSKIKPLIYRTWGHPEYGQLGHNSEGNYLEKSGKVLFHFVYEPTKVVMYIEKDPRSKQVNNKD